MMLKPSPAQCDWVSLKNSVQSDREKGPVWTMIYIYLYMRDIRMFLRCPKSLLHLTSIPPDWVHAPPLMATKVYIVYYSMYGHVEKLAEKIKEGALSIEGVEAKLWQVPETLPDEVLVKMSAPPKSEVPIISPNQLAEADGLLFGFPTRFGMMAAQFKAFLDATGSLWRSQELAGKPAGIFYSTGSQGGGQETTPLTAVTQLAHHGMIFVPIGYTFGAGMFEMEKVKGGSPYGAGTFAGDGSRFPSEIELEQAFHQGKYFAIIAKKLKASA